MGLNDMIRIIFIKHFVLSKIPLIFVPIKRTINSIFYSIKSFVYSILEVENCAFSAKSAFPVFKSACLHFLR